MKQKEITFHYTTADQLSELNKQDRQLMAQAAAAASRAYAPYSGFKVGAAIKLADGNVVTGNNQENAAYPSGLCAERVAVFSAFALYPDAVIDTIAVTIQTKNHDIVEPVSPCGACRQVIAEYEHKQGKKIRVIFSGENGKSITVEGIHNLLPMTFTANNLKYQP